MAFGINMDGRGSGGRAFKPSRSTADTLLVIAFLALAFCVFDYSAYGSGSVASALGDAQRWFQGEVGSLKLKM